MRAAVVLLTRDLRVHDHPALAAAAAEAELVVPLFVIDDRLLELQGSANRLAFLIDSLEDLRRSLRGLGGELVVRRGDPVAETVLVARQVAAQAVFLTEDASAYALAREHRLRSALGRERVALRSESGIAAVPLGDLLPADGDHYRVFTPFWRRWREHPLRSPLAAPGLRRAAGVEEGTIPDLAEMTALAVSPSLPPGGETAGRERMERWLEGGIERYAELHDDLAENATSGLSPYLHFGCVSPLELAARARSHPHGEAFARQLCWRDFYLQLLHANPHLARNDYRPRGDAWLEDAQALAAWREGRTGYPVVDAGMRQLRREGTMPGRARLIAASFLAKDLYLDWRLGAAHFSEQLVDGDVASNTGNWQWVAGTGTDPRPNRTFNPTRQALRFDPRGDYVRRYVPELAGIDGAAVHEPWKLGRGRPSDYPDRVIVHETAAAAFRARRRGRSAS